MEIEEYKSYIISMIENYNFNEKELEILSSIIFCIFKKEYNLIIKRVEEFKSLVSG